MSTLQRSSKDEIARKVNSQDSRFENVRIIVGKLDTREQYVAEINRLWTDVQRRFVAIGKFLVYAKSTLPHGEYEDMIERDLPFGRSMAHAFKKIGEMIMRRQLKDDDLPRDYRAAYMLLSLPDDKLALAQERGLLRIDTTRQMAEAFRREIVPPPPLSAPRLRSLQRQREKVLADMERLQAKLASLEIQIQEISSDMLDLDKQGGSVIDGEVTVITDIDTLPA
jgi:hypothetical protein